WCSTLPARGNHREIHPAPGRPSSVMKQARGAAAGCDRFFALVLPLGLISGVSAAPAIASGCSFEAQGDGRVAAIIDARGFRIEDGREVRLAGIEPIAAEQ